MDATRVQLAQDLVGRRIIHHAPGGKQTGRVTAHQGARIEYQPEGTEGTTVMASLAECTVLPPTVADVAPASAGRPAAHSIERPAVHPL
jgi:hypothetical protein